MYDTIVIGLGAMGSATAFHLARRGQSVLGLEQYGLVHALGSSHGQSRIIRKAYFEHPDYVPLLEQAYTLWHELGAMVDYEVINECGLVLAGRDDDAVVAGTRRAAAEHHLPLEEVEPHEAAHRFPGVSAATDMAVLFDPVGGYLRVEHCVRAHLEQAAEHGAELRSGERVESWSSSAGGVEVVTDHGNYHGRRLAVCAGPWAGRVLGELALPLRTHRVVTAWFPSENSAHQQQNGAPVFAMQTDAGFYYGFPILDERGVKVAEHGAGDLLNDPGFVQREITEDDVALIRSFAGRYVPGLDTTAWQGNACIYTMTPDSDFIIDRHPAHENVFIAAGFSGHGFKFSSAVGSIMADFCERGVTAAPVAFLGLERFRKTI